MRVQKRDNRLVPYEGKRVERVVLLAARACGAEFDQGDAANLEALIRQDAFDGISIEQLSDLIEVHLMRSGHYDMAKSFILYRAGQRQRVPEGEGLLTPEFLSHYKHLPSPMTEIGQFTYLRSYSRWLPEEQRRERWWETVRRAVEYNCSLVPTTRAEAEQLFDNVYNLRQFLSGRTFWIGNTPVADLYPIGNYNCSFRVIDDFEAFSEIFYLLMVGSGAGIRVLPRDVAKLPALRPLTITHEAYDPKPAALREDNSSLLLDGEVATIVVGDSKEGWMHALRWFFELQYQTAYRELARIVINYDNIRGKGEKLKRFGGTASGHSSLEAMFRKIVRVINARQRSGAETVRLKPIDCLDIANIIGENVVSGGVRRTAEVVLISPDDYECLQAKSQLYTIIDGTSTLNPQISHRQMSNNSVFYETRPTREQLHRHIALVRQSGEPGWVNAEAARKRRPNFEGVNPCVEVLANSKGLCNLTTVNVMAYVEAGELNYQQLMEAQRLSVRTGLRMTTVELELPAWNGVQQTDRLLGCSLTGWQDMVNATGMSQETQIALLKQLRKVAWEAAEQYCIQLGLNVPLLITTVKPEGTLSLLPTVSSGVHHSHSPYYIRRIRINATDPLARVVEDLGFPVYPEVGQNWATCTTKYVEFPVRAPEGRTKGDVTALEQLETYKMFMQHYVDHNCSITVHVRPHEWDEVEEWLWSNWDEVVAISLLAYDDSFYHALPYESCTKEEWETRKAAMRDIPEGLLALYETQQEQVAKLTESDCAGGICPIM